MECGMFEKVACVFDIDGKFTAAAQKKKDKKKKFDIYYEHRPKKKTG